MKHSSGILKQAPLGFSWTVLFFGFFVPLLRGDFKWGIIMLILFLVSLWIGSCILSFFYNKIYINGLLESGYLPADEYSRNVLLERGIIVDF